MTGSKTSVPIVNLQPVAAVHAYCHTCMGLMTAVFVCVLLEKQICSVLSQICVDWIVSLLA